mmetsp:Transcript_87240/g.241988  ORF Transcript_87240/g.241988 Transcript_87240/m.241988 type:complete len:228 (-) Transcript_87240:26-709(-)
MLPVANAPALAATTAEAESGLFLLSVSLLCRPSALPLEAGAAALAVALPLPMALEAACGGSESALTCVDKASSSGAGALQRRTECWGPSNRNVAQLTAGAAVNGACSADAAGTGGGNVTRPRRTECWGPNARKAAQPARGLSAGGGGGPLQRRTECWGPNVRMAAQPASASPVMMGGTAGGSAAASAPHGTASAAATAAFRAREGIAEAKEPRLGGADGLRASGGYP